MHYRPLGRTGLQVGAIGLGTEYLIEQTDAKVAAVIHAALDGGVNYFDLFFAQARFRDQMGAAFAGRRHQAVLAAHLGAADVDGQYQCTRDPASCEHFFHDFLRRYRTDHVDVLFLHNSDTQEDLDAILAPGGLREMALRVQAEGKARFLGFSGHNTETARQVVVAGGIDVLMFPVNLTSHAMPGRAELLAACAARQVGLVAMKPYAGGNLLRAESAILVDTYKMGRAALAGAPLRVEKSAPLTPVQCLAYVLQQEAVSTVVPGAADLCQLEAALAWTAAGEAEREVADVAAAYAHFGNGECVHCNHCLPCPARIDVGQTLRLLQLAKARMTPALREDYAALPARASECLSCGDCVSRCPFGVDVPAQMATAAQLFE